MKTVRVFISSTFRDMHAERDHLVTVVFPELRERVEQLGLEFFDVDLRWGVPTKDANGETANSWEYCRQWIDRVEPFFVCILGQRYGWVPEPEQLKSPEDQERQRDNPRSITDLEVRHAVLNDRRKRYSYFYLREKEVPDLPPGAPAEQQAIHNEFVDPPDLLGKLEALKREIRACGRPVRDYPCQWTGSKFVDLKTFGERVLEDLWSGVLRDERYVSKEVWRQALGADPDTDPYYNNAAEPLPREPWERIVALAKPAPVLPLDAEKQQMEAFAASRLRWFQGRTDELEKLTRFIDSADANAPRLAVVAAVPGQGKSALLAKLWQELVLPANGGVPGSPSSTSSFIVSHFVGATERSASAHALVQRLLDELDRSGIEWPAERQEEGQELKRDFNSLCLRLAQRLGDYAGERRIVFLLDALNQLSDGHDLNWLPQRLGPGVRVVVSCIDDPAAGGPRAVVAENSEPLDAIARVPPCPEQLVLHALDSRHPAPLRVPLSELTPTDIRVITTEYLHEYCHELDQEHLDTLCAIPQARNPLYLLVMLNELRTLGGNDLNRLVPARIAAMPRDHPNTVSLFRWVLQRLEVFNENAPDAVQWWCLYLAHGRAGMASHELAELLARRLGADAVANALRIERGLRRYLQRRGPQLDFFHGQLRQAVIEQYGPQAEAATVHADIGTYFRHSADPEGNQSWKGQGPRSFLEVAFHLTNASEFDPLCDVLCNLGFVEARGQFGQVFELVGDYNRALAALPEFREERECLRLRDEAMYSYNRALRNYAVQRADWRDRTERGETIPEPDYPLLPDELETGAERDIPEQLSERAARLRHFANFVNSHLSRLVSRPRETLPFACNHAEDGPVNCLAERLVTKCEYPWLRRSPRPPAPPLRPQCVSILEGHIAGIESVSMSPNGHRVVSGSRDSSLRVWDLKSGACLRILGSPQPAKHALSSILGDDQSTTVPRAVVLPPLPYQESLPVLTPEPEEPLLVKKMGSVTSVCVTPDGQRVITQSRGNAIHVWNLETGACLRRLPGLFGRICVVSPDGRRALADSYNNTVKIWDIDSGACLHTLEGHSESVYSVCVSPDGRRAVSGSLDKTLRVWDMESGACLRALEGHSGQVYSVCVSSDGRCVVSGSTDRTLRIWDMESGACLHTLEGHSESVYSVCVSPDGRCAVSGSGDKTLRVWDMESGACLHTLEGHSESVYSVCVSPDGRRAVSGGEDYTLRVWDLDTCERLATAEGHSSSVVNVCVSPDGLRAVSGSEDHTLRIWDVESGACLRVLGGHRAPVFSVCVSPDGRRAVSGSADTTLHVWDLDTGTCLHTLEGHRNPIMSVYVTPDGRRVISTCFSTARVWDIETGAHLCILANSPMLSFMLSSVCVTPDGRRSISIIDDKTVQIWDIESGACLRALEGHSGQFYRVYVSPDGRCAVSEGLDKTLRVLDLETGACLRTLEGHSREVYEVYSVCVSPDGRRVVSGGEDKTLLIWDLETGVCLRTLEGHGEVVSSVCISPDGRSALSAGSYFTHRHLSNCKIRFWDLETGACLSIYDGGPGVNVTSIAFSPFTGRIVCGTNDGQMHFLTPVNFSPSGPAILTATNARSARCPLCAHNFPPPTEVATTILDNIASLRPDQSPCLDLPGSAFDAPRLITTCPHCQRPLMFNPFFATADHYAAVLLRGVEFSRREKGETHEETLAHLLALAVHLENAGNPDEARQFREQYDRLKPSTQ